MLTDLELEPARLEHAVPTTTKRSRKLPLVVLPLPAPSSGQRLYGFIRRALEVVAAGVLLVISLPVMLVAALAIKLTSRGPALYYQTRVGKGGKHFTIYKLRSMIHQCESLTGPRWCMPDDPRITRIGWLLRRSHVDELPQLVNVLKGQMSLIGPRPERPEFVRELEKVITGYRDREAVLPGITGLAQVQLPPDTEVRNVRRKLTYDLYYIRQLSPWLDFRILCCTASRVLGMPAPLTGRLFGIPTRKMIESVAATAVEETAGPATLKLAA